MATGPVGVTRRRSSRGEGRIGMIIGILLLALIAHVLMKVVPARIANADYSDFVHEKAQLMILHKMDEDGLREILVKQAVEEGLPINDDNIRINIGQSEIAVTVEYSVELKMIWGPWVQNFTIEQTIPKIG